MIFTEALRYILDGKAVQLDGETITIGERLTHFLKADRMMLVSDMLRADFELLPEYMTFRDAINLMVAGKAMFCNTTDGDISKMVYSYNQDEDLFILVEKGTSGEPQVAYFPYECVRSDRWMIYQEE